MHMALWLCKGPSLEGCLVNLPSPASPFTKLCLSFSRLAPATHPNCLQGYLPFLCGCLFYSFPIYIISLPHKSKKRGSFVFSFRKCPMQDKALLNRMCPAVCGYSQNSMAAVPIPSHGAPSHPATTSSAWLCPSLLTLHAEGKQLCFFLLLALQQTALGTTAILIKSLGKYMPIPEVLYKPTHIWPEREEGTRAKQCFYANSLSVSERLQCTQHSDAQKTLVQKPVALLRALLII